MKLSPYGLIKDETNPEEKKKFDWKEAIIDAGILSGITFFTTIGGTSAVGVQGPNGIVAAGISAVLQFLTILAVKRKLIKNGE